MKFIVLTDIHGNEEVSSWANDVIKNENADAVIILGDITQFGPKAWAENFLSAFKVPVYAVPGNCDPPEDILDAISEKATLIHKQKIMLDGVPIIGLGGSNPTIFNTPFELSEDEISASLEPLMEENAVFAFHAPAMGINDTIPSGAHVGSTAIKAMVEKYYPRLVLTGHIHEAKGMVEDNGTVFINPGPAMDRNYAVVEIDRDEIKASLHKA